MKLIIFSLLFVMMTAIYAEGLGAQKKEKSLSVGQNDLEAGAVLAIDTEKNDLKSAVLIEEESRASKKENESGNQRRFGLEIFLYFGVAILLTWFLYYLFFWAGLWVFQMGSVEQYRLILTSCKMSMIWMFAICSCLLVYETDVARANLINAVLLALTVMTKIFFLQKDLGCRMLKAISLGLTITIFVCLVLFSVAAFILLNFVQR